ncbi:PE family protein [Mycobacterium simulans]|uniref:PE family protein n=2 Tax=Mycobacterium simulans TaxID=627089 RepID=UPI00174ADCEF|nr:PE family protein [Mycobacterium simulans]
MTNIVHRQTAEEEYVVPNSVSTESLAAAALDVERIGWAVAVANKAAAAATTGVVAPNADQVSIDVAPLLGAPARSDQVLSAQAMLFKTNLPAR